MNDNGDMARAFLTVADILTAHDYSGLSSMLIVAMGEIFGKEPEQSLRSIDDSNRWPHILRTQQRARMVDAACTRTTM